MGWRALMYAVSIVVVGWLTRAWPTYLISSNPSNHLFTAPSHPLLGRGYPLSPGASPTALP